MRHWSLTMLRETLIKIGAKVVRHAKYVSFQMAEVAVPRKLLQRSLSGISGLGCRRHCCNADECGDMANSMTIPAKDWLVLRSLWGKRPPPHSVVRKWDDVGVQTQA